LVILASLLSIGDFAHRQAQFKGMIVGIKLQQSVYRNPVIQDSLVAESCKGISKNIFMRCYDKMLTIGDSECDSAKTESVTDSSFYVPRKEKPMLYKYYYSERHKIHVEKYDRFKGETISVCEIYYDGQWHRYTYCVPSSSYDKLTDDWLKAFPDAVLLIECKKGTEKLRINDVIQSKEGEQ
jgi:hypothetical protein